MKQRNPSSKDFGRMRGVSSEVLKESKDRLRPFRKIIKVLDAKNNPDKYSLDFGCCWMCWNDITGEWLDDWRHEPFSENKKHEEECPLCGYKHWQGRIWYPFRYEKNYIGNPSARDGIK